MIKRNPIKFRIIHTIIVFTQLLVEKLIILIDQIHHDLRHHILFLCAALGNHQRQGDQRVVIQKARTVSTVENPIVLQKPKEQEGGDTLVTVAERMVLNCQIE